MGILKSNRRGIQAVRKRYDGAYGLLPSCYRAKVLSYNPIVYWMLAEAAGATAIDQVNSPAQDGVHVGVTLGQSGIGEPCGTTSGFYDGVNDYTNVQTAALAAAFNSGEGTAIVWGQVANAGVWTDGAFRNNVTLFADVNNFVDILRWSLNGQMAFRYIAGGVARQVLYITTSPIVFFSAGITWSISAGINGEMRAYFNGAQVGVTQVNLGIWAGALATSVIGANSIIPGQVWHGDLAHVPVWDRALTPAEMADLAIF